MARYLRSGVIFNNEQGDILIKIEYDAAAEQTYVETKIVVPSGVYCMPSEVDDRSEEEVFDHIQNQSDDWEEITEAEWDAHQCNKPMKRGADGGLIPA
jgi:hypothetical protein